MVSSVTSSNILALRKATDSAAAGGASSLASSTSSSGSSSSTAGAFASMASNENNFLTLLTTQLKHQDPSSPMDSQNMASQIAQFTAVEQQVQTNANLNTLISLNESSQLTQNKTLVGQTATFSSSVLPLQSGQAHLSYTAASGEVIGISIADKSGKIVRHALGEANGGTNNWTWDGKDDNGNSLPDGSYSVALKTVDNTGTTSNVPYTITGKITGVKKGNTGLSVMMGSTEVPMSSVQSTT